MHSLPLKGFALIPDDVSVSFDVVKTLSSHPYLKTASPMGETSGSVHQGWTSEGPPWKKSDDG